MCGSSRIFPSFFIPNSEAGAAATTAPTKATGVVGPLVSRRLRHSRCSFILGLLPFSHFSYFRTQLAGRLEMWAARRWVQGSGAGWLGPLAESVCCHPPNFSTQRARREGERRGCRGGGGGGGRGGRGGSGSRSAARMRFAAGAAPRPPRPEGQLPNPGTLGFGDARPELRGSPGVPRASLSDSGSPPGPCNSTLPQPARCCLGLRESLVPRSRPARHSSLPATGPGGGIACVGIACQESVKLSKFCCLKDFIKRPVLY